MGKGCGHHLHGKNSYELISESHLAVLDGFVSRFRKQCLEWDKKSPDYKRPADHVHERSDDLDL